MDYIAQPYMRFILPVIVVSQFLCTSLWFAGNSIIGDLVREFYLEPQFLAHITSAVQFGFITGTLVFAVLTISDRYSPSKVFFISSVLAALFNLGICFRNIQAAEIMFFRFFTGFFLAGIYPVGMKIASDHFEKGLGKSLGFLVGALVLGTAFPHLLKGFTIHLPWKMVMYATSALSVLGGLSILLFVPDGPFRKAGQKLNLTAFANGFKQQEFRAASFGYFGHMWELYTFWAFVPVMLAAYNNRFPSADIQVHLFSFLIIAFGGPACVFSGLVSQRLGAKRIATTALILSGMCCALSPFFLFGGSPLMLLLFLFFWGFVVIDDSPMFSTLVARYAVEESRGTSLTIVNCIGFSITIVSIQVINMLSAIVSPQYLYTFLAIGPALGIIALLRDTSAAKAY